MKSKINSCIQNAVDNYTNLLLSESIKDSIALIASKSIEAFRLDKKMLLCGNGGSAADAQHIASEFSGRFYYSDKPPLYAEALHVNSSYMTAVANDYGYDEVYSRMIDAKGRAGDILIGISTSGKSSNVINALNKANSKGMLTVGFTGDNGGQMEGICSILIKVPSNDIPRIQEAHILIGHIICEIIEKDMRKWTSSSN